MNISLSKEKAFQYQVLSNLQPSWSWIEKVQINTFKRCFYVFSKNSIFFLTTNGLCFWALKELKYMVRMMCLNKKTFFYQKVALWHRLHLVSICGLCFCANHDEGGRRKTFMPSFELLVKWLSKEGSFSVNVQLLFLSFESKRRPSRSSKMKSFGVAIVTSCLKILWFCTWWKCKTLLIIWKKFEKNFSSVFYHPMIPFIQWFLQI